MTENKPIMIDGIDVSGCEHLYREIDCLAHIDFSECCEGYNHSYGYCPNIPNCYYKQLTRKTQECEELKDKIKYMEEYIKTVENARDELERENKFSNEQAEQKLERIRKYFKNKDISQTSLFNINCIEQDILQIIDEVENE